MVFFEPTTASGTQVDGLQYYNSYYYSFQAPSGGGSTGTGTTSGRTESYRFKLYIGYEQWVQQDTFALAVVVWRNGKLVK